MRSLAVWSLSVALGSLMLIGAAMANPLGGGASSLIEAAPKLELLQVRHGRITCVRGQNGWHYHNVRGERIVCPPRPRSAFVSWRCTRFKCGWYHRGQKRFL